MTGPGRCERVIVGTLNTNKYQCVLPAGHDLPHVCTIGTRIMSWSGPDEREQAEREQRERIKKARR